MINTKIYGLFLASLLGMYSATLSAEPLPVQASLAQSEPPIVATATDGLPPKVLNLALQAYQNARNLGIRPSKPVLTIIDYSMPSTAKRLWVLDLKRNRVLFNSFVAHGKGSGENFATRFSDQNGTLASSLGLFVTEATYMGGHGYSLKIKGLEKGFNEHAEARHIVFHQADYVSTQAIKVLGRIGRSWGCPAVEAKISKPLFDTIKDGTLVFAYYPNPDWLHKSIFLQG